MADKIVLKAAGNKQRKKLLQKSVKGYKRLQQTAKDQTIFIEHQFNRGGV